MPNDIGAGTIAAEHADVKCRAHPHLALQCHLADSLIAGSNASLGLPTAARFPIGALVTASTTQRWHLYR